MKSLGALVLWTRSAGKKFKVRFQARLNIYITQLQDWYFMTFPFISFCSLFFQFLFPGNAQQVQFLRLLIYSAAREGAQQFLEMIFSTSAGRLVFDAYKDSRPLPEVVARDHGHNETACYLKGVTKRYIIHRTESQKSCHDFIVTRIVLQQYCMHPNNFQW